MSGMIAGAPPLAKSIVEKLGSLNCAEFRGPTDADTGERECPTWKAMAVGMKSRTAIDNFIMGIYEVYRITYRNGTGVGFKVGGKYHYNSEDTEDVTVRYKFFSLRCKTAASDAA